jgi:hypothetical protein
VQFSEPHVHGHECPSKPLSRQSIVIASRSAIGRAKTFTPCRVAPIACTPYRNPMSNLDQETKIDVWSST